MIFINSSLFIFIFKHNYLILIMFTTLFYNNNNNNPNILLIGSGWSARGFIDSINTKKYIRLFSLKIEFIY